MQTTQYLYDCSPIEFANLPYKEALEFKAAAAYKLVTKLYIPHFTKRDDTRLRAAVSAEKYNYKLLDELKVSEKEANDGTKNTEQDHQRSREKS